MLLLSKVWAEKSLFLWTGTCQQDRKRRWGSQSEKTRFSYIGGEKKATRKPKTMCRQERAMST